MSRPSIACLILGHTPTAAFEKIHPVVEYEVKRCARCRVVVAERLTHASRKVTLSGGPIDGRSFDLHPSTENFSVPMFRNGRMHVAIYVRAQGFVYSRTEPRL